MVVVKPKVENDFHKKHHSTVSSGDGGSWLRGYSYEVGESGSDIVGES